MSDVPPTETSTSDKLMRDALLLELAHEIEDAGGRMVTQFRIIARKLVEKAAAGDVAAIKEVLDRIDGKSVQGTVVPDEQQGKVTIEWDDHESASATGPASNSAPSTAAPSASPAS